jgi:hypothetical protein
MKIQIELIKGLSLGVEYLDDIDVYNNGEPIDLLRVNLLIICLYIAFE